MSFMETVQTLNLDTLQDLPGYRAILKAVLRSQIKQLVEQLSAHTGEESLLLTASVSDGTLSHVGSEFGQVFLDNHGEFKSKFLGFCLSRQHNKEHLAKSKKQTQKTTSAAYLPCEQTETNTDDGTSVYPVSMHQISKLSSHYPKYSSSPNTFRKPQNSTYSSSPNVSRKSSSSTKAATANITEQDVNLDIKDECSIGNVYTDGSGGMLEYNMACGFGDVATGNSETTDDYHRDGTAAIADSSKTSLNNFEMNESYAGDGDNTMVLIKKEPGLDIEETQYMDEQTDYTSSTNPIKFETTGKSGFRNNTVEFICETCGEKFTRKFSLNRHLLRHNKLGRFYCCGKAFQDSNALRKHRANKHNGPKPFVCPSCGAKFATKAALHRHERMEKGEGFKNCTICSYSGRDDSALQDHMATHSHEKLHKCDVCTKVFKHQSSFSRHKKTHF